jgi:hypothetical protein
VPANWIDAAASPQAIIGIAIVFIATSSTRLDRPARWPDCVAEALTSVPF